MNTLDFHLNYKIYRFTVYDYMEYENSGELSMGKCMSCSIYFRKKSRINVQVLDSP